MAESLELLPERDVSQLLLQQFHMNEFIWFFLFRVFSCAVFFSFFFFNCIVYYCFMVSCVNFQKTRRQHLCVNVSWNEVKWIKDGENQCDANVPTSYNLSIGLRSHTINLLFVLNLIQELLRLHYWHLYMHIYVMCIFDWKMF